MKFDQEFPGGIKTRDCFRRLLYTGNKMDGNPIFFSFYSAIYTKFNQLSTSAGLVFSGTVMPFAAKKFVVIKLNLNAIHF